jgi:hypothetical protein
MVLHNLRKNLDRYGEDVRLNWLGSSDQTNEDTSSSQPANIPSKPAVKRIRSANSLVFFKNSCRPGRSKTVT